MAVNLSFIGGAGWQFFDDSGNPLSGGKIYTYAAGTTTPQATYTSRDGLTPNTNPVILDAAGRTPQEIWATEGLLYKYVVKTSTDVLIRSWDNIGGSVVSSDLAANLASTTDNAKGDALIGFRQSGPSGFLTGTVGRTVNDKLQETISVADFGVVGDGTDEATKLQAALDAARPLGAAVTIPRNMVVSIGSTVNIPTGTALIGGNGRKRGFTLESNSPTVKALSTIGTNPMFTMALGDDNSITRRYHGMYGVRVDGNSFASVGISVRNAVNTDIIGNLFIGFAADGAAIRGGGNLYTFVQQNSFIAGNYYAVDFLESYAGGSAHYYGVNVGNFSENIVSANRGIRYSGTFDILRNDFEFKSEGGYAINVATEFSTYTNIEGNYFEIITPTANPTAGMTLIKLPAQVNFARIVGNSMYGDVAYSGGVAIDLSAMNFGSFEARGNWIADIETGIKFPTVSSPNIIAGPNAFRPEVVNQSLGRQERLNVTAAGAVNNTYNFISTVEAGADLRRGATSFGAVYTFNQTAINLDHGNAFYIASISGAVTYSAVVNPRQGQMFWIMAVNDNLITLAHSAFNLACGADLLLRQDRPLLFMVDDSLVVREVGRNSLLMWSGVVADLPSATALGVGARLIVTDANATTFASAVVGGGANTVPVYSNGTNWRIG